MSSKESLDPQASKQEGIRGHVKDTCYNCLKKNVELRLCAQCKTMTYCSRQCQKEHWPKHKASCNKYTEFGVAAANKVSDHFFHNAFLVSYLHSAIFLHCKAQNRTLSRDVPVHAELVIGIEPTDIREFKRLGENANLTDDGRRPRGMFQLLSLTVPTKPISFLTKEKENYQKARATFDQAGLRDFPIAMIKVVHCNDRGGFDSLVTLPLSEWTLRMLESGKSVAIPSAPGEKDIEKPLTADACIEFINMSIRLDKENEYRVRRKMVWADISMLMHAIHNYGNSEKNADLSLAAWRSKFVREDVYREVKALQGRRYSKARK